MEVCLWQEFTIPYRFPVRFTRHVFAPDNPALSEVTQLCVHPHVLAVVDAGLADADPDLTERLEAYCLLHPEAMKLMAPVQILPGGERCKTGRRQVEKLHNLFLQNRMCRHSLVLAVGGGAFLDVVGYAAATAHRGIRLVRLPTTTLAQNDAGIGVKNGYNAFGRKNWVGTFVPPLAVINDFEFLKSLPPRQRRAGIVEAVKVAVIRDNTFFDYISERRQSLAQLAADALELLIVRCAQLHLNHIATGDPFERGSGRPLDFGHWIAHALEEASAGRIVHGEAVAIGIALDCRYAAAAGLMAASEADLVIDLLAGLGFSLCHPLLAEIDLAEALDRFRQHLGGTLSITMPTCIGRSIEVDRISLALMDRSRQLLMSQGAR